MFTTGVLCTVCGAQVLVDYIVNNGHIYQQISKIIPNSEILLLDTDYQLSGN